MMEDKRLDRTETFGGAAGTTTLTTCVVATRTGTTPTTVTTTSVSAPSAVKHHNISREKMWYPSVIMFNK